MDKDTLNYGLSKKFDIPLERLHPDFRKVCEIIGREKTIELARRIGGLRVYVPQAGRLRRAILHHAIREEFTGANYRELALKYGYSENWIREIVAGRA